MALAIYGVENQAKIHYAMPVKNNLYDAIEYACQVEEIAKIHRKQMKYKKAGKLAGDKESEGTEKVSGDEFLSGFWKSDRLVPSITLTIYFGAKKWDAPINLIDMVGKDEKDEDKAKLLKLMSNYHVHLIAPKQMKDEDIMKFQSSFREVMFFIKYLDDKDKLKDILISDSSRFEHLERRAADVIKAVTNMNIEYGKVKGNKEEVNMCAAVEEMVKEGEENGMRKVAMKMHRNGFSVDSIAEYVDYPIEEVKKWIDSAGIGDEARISGQEKRNVESSKGCSEPMFGEDMFKDFFSTMRFFI